MVSQIEALVAEVASLRSSNAQLREEVRGAVAMFDRGTSAIAGARGKLREPLSGIKSAGAPRGRRPRGRVLKGRATPAHVTAEVVRATLAKLGEATASDIAAEITRAGTPVSGRAIRFIAEAAGATTVMGEEGKRRYRL